MVGDAKSPTLSLAMIAKNEARCIGRCLRSVRDLTDEIIVVDTGSHDGTPELARDSGAKLFSFHWINDFAAARNFALAQASSDWVLVLDADEHASEELCREIHNFIRGPQAVGRLKVVSDYRRDNQTLRSQCFVSRLFPRGARFEGRIHEQLISPLPRKDLDGSLWHDGYLETHKTDRNIRLLQSELQRSPGNAYYLFQLALEFSSLKNTSQALNCLREAFSKVQMDEPFAPNVVVDYLYALMASNAFEEGLAVIERIAGKFEDFPDLHLVCGLFYMNLVRSKPQQYLAYLPKVESSFQRSLAVGETKQYKSVQGAGSFLAFYNLGLLYHVFEQAEAAQSCFAEAARLGYEPARSLLVNEFGAGLTAAANP